ncbi:hypothetical protein ABT010_31360 [Streptomyces sp. NPDC002668]|uniref:hypothetical protein n=1 Tax=Streptomyces sp. NPDC002668 TaxID=3154422 RepID=UPI003323F00E
MIKPEDIPRFTGNLEVLEKAVGALDADGSGFTSTGSDIHSRFQSLASYYEAPEAEKLFATTAAVQTTGENLGSDVESVARALGEYANEIRPLVARLETLRSEATAFVAEAKADDNLLSSWQRDQDKIDKNEELVNGVTATTTAFWEAERTAANKIMALFSCIKYRANDGSNKPDMYGFSADALKDAELPWGSVEERTFLPGNIDRHIKSFVWDGLIVDNIWGTIQGLGALVGIGADASDTWAALGRVFIGAGDYLQDPLNDRPGGLGDTPLGQQSRKDAKDFAKGLVAWDMWSENPARASATVVFNVLTLGVGPLKAGTAAKAGLGAKAAGTAAKIGELLDPVSATVKAAGAAAPKIAEITAGLRKAVPDLPDLADGSVRLPDGSILRTVDGELVITKLDGSVAGKATAELSAADRAALDDASRAPERTSADVAAGARSPGATAHVNDNPPPRGGQQPVGRDAQGAGESAPGAGRDTPGSADAGRGADSGPAEAGATVDLGSGSDAGSMPDQGSMPDTPGHLEGSSGSSGLGAPAESGPLQLGGEAERQVRDALASLSKNQMKPKVRENIISRLAEHRYGQEVAEILTSGRLAGYENYKQVVSSMGSGRVLMLDPAIDQLRLGDQFHHAGLRDIGFEDKGGPYQDLDVRVRDENGSTYGYQMKRLNNPKNPFDSITKPENLRQVSSSQVDHKVMLVDGQGTVAEWTARGIPDELLAVHRGEHAFKSEKGRGITFVIRLDDGTLVIPPGSKTDPGGVL